MAFVRQIVITLTALLLAGVGWLYLSEVPGRYLLSGAVATLAALGYNRRTTAAG